MSEYCRDFKCSRSKLCRRYSLDKPPDAYGRYSEWNKECDFYLPPNDEESEQEKRYARREAENDARKDMM